MSNKGPMWQVALMAGLVTAVVGYVFAGARLDWKSWDIAAIILLPVFMSYKSAITRHNGGHFAWGFSALRRCQSFSWSPTDAGSGGRKRESGASWR